MTQLLCFFNYGLAKQIINALSRNSEKKKNIITSSERTEYNLNFNYGRKRKDHGITKIGIRMIKSVRTFAKSSLRFGMRGE